MKVIIREYQTEKGNTRYAADSADDGFRWGTGRTPKEALDTARRRYGYRVEIEK